MRKLNYKVAQVTFLFCLILIPFNNCGGDFAVLMEQQQFSSSAPQESLLEGQKLYQVHCASCHGVIHTSTKRDRSAQDIFNAFSSVRAMAGLSSKLDSFQIASISLALKSQKSLDGRLQFACEPQPMPNNAIHRLSNRELENTINSLLTSIHPSLIVDANLSQLLNSLPTDNFSRKENTYLVTPELVSGQFEIAFYLGNYIASSPAAKKNFPGTSGCLELSPISQSCASNFIKELGTLAFRRPLTSLEQESFKTQFFDSSLSSDNERLVSLMTSVLMNPDFLYLIFDGGSLNADGSLKLNAYEYASKISYTLTGTSPDPTLRSLASSGEILVPGTASVQASRLIKTELGKLSVLRFFKEWLHYDQFDVFNYSTDVLNGQSLTNLRVAMEKEVDDFLVDTLVTKEGTYKDILTSTNSFIYDNSLAQIYGISNPSGPVKLSSQNRAGLLTRAAFLAKRSGPMTSPVKRGLLVKEALLCEGVGSPPPDAPTMLEPLPANTYLTTRERLEHLTMKVGTSCINCHSVMNNLGFPFEMYDTLGRVRDREKIFDSNGTYSGRDLVINTQSESKEFSTAVTPLVNAIDMSEKLSTNDKALSCFAKKWNEYQLKRAPTSADGCLLNDSLNTVYGKGNQQGSVQEMIKNTIQSEQFKKWNYLAN